MELRALGRTGLTVSALGLGAGPLGEADLDEPAAQHLLDAALDLGVTLIDTAPSYGCSEERLGRHLGARRGRVVLSTKGGYGAHGAADWTGPAITRGVEQALVRLRTDWIDVFHLHSCPREVAMRPDILEALDHARAAGKIRVAAYSGENEALAWAAHAGRFGALQCSINLFDQASLAHTVPEASAAGLGVIGKRALGNAPWRFADRPHGHYAEVYWTRMRELRLEPGPRGWEACALRFAAHAPGVSAVLTGTRHPAHLQTNARAVAEGPLPQEELARIRAAFDHERGWPGQV